MRFLLLLLVAWAFVLTACEETLVEPAYVGSVSVTVLDARTSQPLANTALSTTPATGSYATDAQGKAVLTAVPEGTVSIVARRNGYDQLVSSVTVTRDQTQSIVLLLTRATNATPPSAADRPTPANGSINQPVTLTLGWRPVNATKDDSLRYDEKAKTLTIGERKGTFPGMQAQRTFRVVWVSTTKPTPYDLEATPAKTVAYSGAAVTVKME